MFTHDTTLQTLRISLIAVAALAIAAFGALSAVPRVQLSMQATAVSTSVAATPVVSRATCPGAYVTGDMVGDASPSTVYEALCGAP